MSTNNTDVFGTKKGVVPKPVISQKKDANLFVNKHTRQLYEQQKKFEKETKGMPFESLMEKYLSGSYT
jgi:hypothetical protein